MIRSILLPVAALAVIACSQNPASTENANDYAARIGEGRQADLAAQTASGQPATVTPEKVQTAPPHGADVTKLETLGEVAGVNLGPRDGGCSFRIGDTDMLTAVALRDPAMSGKGVIRVGSSLVLLDSGPGGLAAVEKGTSFTGEGVRVTVTPEATEDETLPRSANVSVTAADGKTKTYSGKWICA